MRPPAPDASSAPPMSAPASRASSSMWAASTLSFAGTSSTSSNPVRLGRTALAAGQSSSQDSSLLYYGGRSGGVMTDAGSEPRSAYEYEDDSDFDYDEGDFTEHLSEVGTSASARLKTRRSMNDVARNRLAVDGRDPLTTVSAHRTHTRRRRPRRRGIPLDEQRAAPPPPISTRISFATRSMTDGPMSAPGALHAADSTTNSSSIDSEPALPRLETTNRLRQSERRVQVRRTHKLAYMLGGEVLVDGDRFDKHFERGGRAGAQEAPVFPSPRQPELPSLPTRRSLESIRTTRTLSTLADSTRSSIDEAAFERRVQAQEREERRRRLAKMTRWLGVVVPTELVNPSTSPSGVSSRPLKVERSYNDRMIPTTAPKNQTDFLNDLAIASGSATSGLGSTLHGSGPEEVKNRMAKVAGRFIKLGHPSSSGASPSGGLHFGTTGTSPGPSSHSSGVEGPGFTNKAATYKRLRPEALDLSRTGFSTFTGKQRAGSSPAGPNSSEDNPSTPTGRLNALSPRERLANVRRANKLERVFGEAPPHVLFAAGTAARPHSNSAPVTPRFADHLGSGVLHDHHDPGKNASAVQAALAGLIVNVPTMSGSTSRKPLPYETSIVSSPGSFRSAYRQSLDSLEYLLDNDVPLLNEMMNALEEDDDDSNTPSHSVPPSTRQPRTPSTRTSTVVANSTQVNERQRLPKSPEMPGHFRRHSIQSPTWSGISSDLVDRQSRRHGVKESPRLTLEAAQGHHVHQLQRSIDADDAGTITPLQAAPWDLLPYAGLDSAASQRGATVSEVKAGASSSRRSLTRSSLYHTRAGGPSSASSSPADEGNDQDGQDAISDSRRASAVSHLSQLSTAPSLSTLGTGSSPPPSPRDAISAEHEVRRQRALRAQKLGRFFGASPGSILHEYSRAGPGPGPGQGQDEGGGGRARARTVSAPLDDDHGGPALSSAIKATTSSGPHDNSSARDLTTSPPSRGRRLAPRSAGSAKPQSSFLRMLRSLEEEANEDDSLSAAERREIRDRLLAMRRRGGDGLSWAGEGEDPAELLAQHAQEMAML